MRQWRRLWNLYNFIETVFNKNGVINQYDTCSIRFRYELSKEKHTIKHISILFLNLSIYHPSSPDSKAYSNIIQTVSWDFTCVKCNMCTVTGPPVLWSKVTIVNRIRLLWNRFCSQTDTHIYNIHTHTRIHLHTHAHTQSIMKILSK